MFSRLARLVAVALMLDAYALGAEVPSASVARSSSNSSNASTPTQVLLLRDGRTFVGAITPGKDAYRVQVSEGFVQVPAKEVEAVCPDVKAAYAERRRRLPPNQAAVHLELSKWCLGHRLLIEAEQELQTATRLEPNLAELDVVRRRLEWTTKPHLRQTSPAAPEAATVQAAAPSESGEPSADPLPRDADLDRLVRGLSAGVTSEFTTYIQPSLLNRCATAACHAATSDHGPKLVRSSRHGQLPRRVTLRNLEETLAYIDRSRPGESPLLKKAVEPHGGSKVAVLDRNHLAYRQLSQWVRRVSGATVRNPAPIAVSQTDPRMSAPREVVRAAAELPLDFAEPDSAADISERKRRPTRETGSRQAPSIPWVRDLLDEQPANVIPGNAEPDEIDELTAEIEADMDSDPFAFDPPADRDELLGKPRNMGQFQPVDAFDPEIFNRQFSPDTQPNAGTTGATGARPWGEPDRTPPESGDTPR
jgi:hypothetical protein